MCQTKEVNGGLRRNQNRRHKQEWSCAEPWKSESEADLGMKDKWAKREEWQEWQSCHLCEGLVDSLLAVQKKWVLLELPFYKGWEISEAEGRGRLRT